MLGCVEKRFWTGTSRKESGWVVRTGGREVLDVWAGV